MTIFVSARAIKILFNRQNKIGFFHRKAYALFTPRRLPFAAIDLARLSPLLKHPERKLLLIIAKNHLDA